MGLMFVDNETGYRIEKSRPDIITVYNNSCGADAYLYLKDNCIVKVVDASALGLPSKERGLSSAI